MTTDAAFLDELSAFLNASDLPLIHTPWNVNHDSYITFGTPDTASVSLLDSPTIFNDNTVTTVETCIINDIHMTKVITKREKEVVRKQRYQMRLKNERDTLRKMKVELSLQLEKLKQVQKRQKGSHASNENSPWRSIAIQQHQQRLLAETEQKHLHAAINVQTSYIGKLRLALPDHCNVLTTSVGDNVLVHCEPL